MKKYKKVAAIECLALAIDKISLPHPVRIGIDGMSAAGKTVLANELAKKLRGMGRFVIRSGLDSFHNPKEIRHRQGRMSIKGYIEDSFDYKSVCKEILIPLGPKGDGMYREGIFDYKKEQLAEKSTSLAPIDSILIFEGVMLFNNKLKDMFDYRILVHCSEDEVMKRAKERDHEHFGSIDILKEKYFQRFLPGQRIHVEKNKPHETADAVIFNSNPENPIIKFNSPYK